MRWLSILVLALALVAAGCGGGDDESASDDSETTTLTDTTTDETTTEDTTTETSEETTDDDDSGSFASEDCLELGSAAAALGQAFSGTGDNEDVSELYNELAERAPDEIKEDLQTLAGAWSEIAAALQDLDLGAGEVPSADQLQEYQAALASVSTPEVTEASERLSAWAEANC